MRRRRGGRRDAVHVRSHRRGGRRRRLVLAPWIVISTVSVLLLSGVSAGYAWLATSGCSGPPVKISVLSSPTVARILDNLGRRWVDTGPAVGDRCVAVEVVSKNSAEAAQALGPTWDPRQDGPRPHVWVPDSTAWMKLASTRDDAARLIPDRQPSLARSPTVVAMPMPMAEALGWPDAKLSWKQLGTELASSEAQHTWARLGHPEWGPFKIGMINPVTSTAGLHALTAVADSDDDGRITDSERQTVMALSRTMTVYADDPAKIVGELTKRDVEGEKKVLPYLSAFPIQEQELRAYNDTNPRVPLAAVYPTDGSADADYPYLTLDVPWSDAAQRQAAKSFGEFVRGPEGRQAFLDNFFRDPNRKPGRNLTTEYGVQPRLATVPRAVLVPDSVSLTVGAWVAANRPTNVLFVLDVSESMTQPVRGTENTRLRIARRAVSQVVTLLGDQARAGLWAFGSGLDGDADHVELAPIGPLGETLDGGPRRAVLQNELDALSAAGSDASGVYDTALASYQHLGRHYIGNATNLVVLVSDGSDDGADASLQKTISELKAARHPKQVARLVTVGYGADADVKSLEQLATATGGRSYHAQHETDLNSILITALFNA